ncbi:ATP-dependent DNA helicase RecQ [Alishewanella longhuensis]
MQPCWQYGVGYTKLSRYGKEFIQEIGDYLANSASTLLE